MPRCIKRFRSSIVPVLNVSMASGLDWTARLMPAQINACNSWARKAGRSLTVGVSLTNGGHPMSPGGKRTGGTDWPCAGFAPFSRYRNQEPPHRNLGPSFVKVESLMALLALASEYCDPCKSSTKRCEYYPAGRSRQHGKCLECDRKDPRTPKGLQRKDARYCYECNREQDQSQSH
jgi:hypothetical protein